MHVSQIHLRNFRCYEDVEIEFHPSFNIFVGINGTGKSSALEALRIAIGSLFLGVDKYKDKIASPGISQDDVRLARLEQQYPVVISSKGVIEDFSADEASFHEMEIEWERSLTTKGGTTRSANAKKMKEVSVCMQEAIRKQGEIFNIPLVAYYSTDRFKKEKKDVGVEPDGSRLRGYYNALDPLTNIKFFLDLYYTETLFALQHNTPSVILQAVNEAVRKCVDCDDLMFDIKSQELLLIQHDTHQGMPFHLLSDGVRSMLALVMEMAFRCYLLNPHLGKEATLLTSGVVLIDEIDLHLHPAWQKRVVGDLHAAFPKIQFVVTTHAPLVIGSLRDGKIFTIKDNQVYDFPLQTGKDANYILNEMGTSEMDDTIKRMLKEYFLLIEKGEGKEQSALSLRAQLEQQLGVGHTELQRADMMLSFF